jgi:type IV pilus assembly protein PilW
MKNNRGFTLVEMMISVAIFGIVMAGIYQTYDSQQKTYIVQEHVIDMQQNHRTAIYFLGQELRMAGYDPTSKADVNANSGFYMDPPGFTIIGIGDTPAEIGEFKITMDLNGDRDIDSSQNDNDTNEIIRYALTNDADKDGVSDAIDKTGDWINSGAECNLGRENITLNGSVESSNGLQPVANNIDAIEFLYILKNGDVTSSVDDIADKLEDIRGVIVSILARTKNMIKGYRNTKTYLPASNEIDGTTWGPFDDSYRRNLYITRFKCRNMGRNPYEAMK